MTPTRVETAQSRLHRSVQVSHNLEMRALELFEEATLLKVGGNRVAAHSNLQVGMHTDRKRHRLEFKKAV